MQDGLQEKEAEEKAIIQMGDAEEIGKKLNKIHNIYRRKDIVKI